MKRVGLLLVILSACAARAKLPAPVYPLVATSRATFPARPASSTEPPALTMPTVGSYQLANGLRVLTVERPQAKTIALEYVALQGAEGTSPEQLGWTTLATRVMAQTLRQAGGEDVGGAVMDARRAAAGTGRVASYLAAETTPERLGEWLALVVAALANHELPTDVLSLAVDDQLDALHDEMYWQSGLARMHALRILYGDDDPLGQSLNGSLQTLKPLTVAQLQAHHAAAFAPEHSALVVVGNFEGAALRAQLEQAFARLPRSGLPMWDVAAPSARSESRARGLLTGGKTAYVVEAFPAPAYGSRDWAPYTLLASITAELWSSRLMHELRERLAKTYGVHGEMELARAGNTFGISLQVAPEDLLQALRSIDEQLAALRESTVSASELTVAKLQMREGIAESLETEAGTCYALARLYAQHGEQFARSPAGMLDAELQAIDAASVEDLRDVAQRYFTPERRAVAVSGPLLEFEYELSRWYGRGVDFFVPKKWQRYF